MAKPCFLTIQVRDQVRPFNFFAAYIKHAASKSQEHCTCSELTMEDHNNDDDAISSSEVSRLRWHVFLSFRGEDTRYPFINNLYTSLHNKGIRAFRDDDGLRRGDEIAPTLLDAIEESAASIVIISQNYADSRWCLEELSKICECKRLILPVFYQVDPSDVRKQRGPFFGKHFREHEEKGIEKEKVMKWRKAMETAGGKAGFVFKDKDIDRYVCVYLYVYCIFFTIMCFFTFVFMICVLLKRYSLRNLW